MSIEDIVRIDAELDRLRWYIAKLTSELSSSPGLFTTDQLIRLLKTGEWEGPQ